MPFYVVIWSKQGDDAPPRYDIERHPFEEEAEAVEYTQALDRRFERGTTHFTVVNASSIEEVERNCDTMLRDWPASTQSWFREPTLPPDA